MHCVGVGVWLGDYGVGVTRGMVDGFLMANGQPIDVIQGWIDQLPSVISLSSPQSFLASSQSFHHSDNHFLPHPFLFFVPESKKKFLVFLHLSFLLVSLSL